MRPPRKRLCEEGLFGIMMVFTRYRRELDNYNSLRLELKGLLQVNDSEVPYETA
jgi:hypothetical protein